MKKKRRILILEDDGEDRELMKIALEKAEYKDMEDFCFYAESKALLEAIDENSETLVLDNMLSEGGKTGLDVLKEIKSTHPFRLFYPIIISGHITATESIQYQKNGAKDIIEKDREGTYLELIESIKEGETYIRSEKEKAQIIQNLEDWANDLPDRIKILKNDKRAD